MDAKILGVEVPRSAFWWLLAAGIGFAIVKQQRKQSCREAALRRCQELYPDDQFRRDACLSSEDMHCQLDSTRTIP